MSYTGLLYTPPKMCKISFTAVIHHTKSINCKFQFVTELYKYKLNLQLFY